MSDISERLEHAAAARKEKQSDGWTGKGLAEEAGGEDTLTWVLKSRRKEEERKERRKRGGEKGKKKGERARARERAAAIEAQEEEVSGIQVGLGQLRGARVAHALDDFEEGETRILTLKDSSVLDEEEEDLVLEDVHKKEEERREMHKRRAKKGYDVYEELEEGKKSLLGKYDEEKEEEGFRLQGGVTSTKKKEEQLADIRSKLSKSLAPSPSVSSSSLPVSVSLGTKRQLQADYETAGASVGFKKKKKRSKKAEKEAGGQRRQAGGADLLAELLAGATDSEEDYGVRGKIGGGGGATASSEAVRSALSKQKLATAYTKAIAKAKAASKLLLEEDGAEDDSDLYAAISKSRKRALRGQKVSVVAAVAAAREKRKEKEKEEAEGGGGVVFTQTDEFCRNLTMDVVERKPAGGAGAGKGGGGGAGGEDAEMAEALDGATIVSDVRDEERKEKEAEERQKREEEEAEAEEAEVSVVGEEPLASEGLAATLKLMEMRNEPLLHDRGEMYGGRRTDKKLLADDPAPHINLDHRDEYGRLLPPREAFRRQSHVFHGKKPGKNKQEKMQQRYKEDMKVRYMAFDDTPNGTVGKMKKEQERTGRAYVEVGGSRRDVRQVTGPSDRNALRSGGVAKAKETAKAAFVPAAPLPVKQKEEAPVLGQKSTFGFKMALTGSKRQAPQGLEEQPAKRQKTE